MALSHPPHGLYPQHLWGLWWQQEPETSQIITVIGPWNQTWFPEGAQTWILTWPQVAAQATQVSMAPVCVWHLDTNIAPGGSPNPWHWDCLGWYQEVKISTETMAVVGPQTQAWSSSAALAQVKHHGPSCSIILRHRHDYRMWLGSRLGCRHHRPWLW